MNLLRKIGLCALGPGFLGMSSLLAAGDTMVDGENERVVTQESTVVAGPNHRLMAIVHQLQPAASLSAQERLKALEKKESVIVFLMAVGSGPYTQETKDLFFELIKRKPQIDFSVFEKDRELRLCFCTLLKEICFNCQHPSVLDTETRVWFNKLCAKMFGISVRSRL
jgi:hypothetical protein